MTSIRTSPASAEAPAPTPVPTQDQTAIARGFDRLSPAYDLIAGAVFGNSLRRSQSCFLDRLPRDADVLVVGGGSGWFLEQLLAGSGCRHVLYLEISPGMLRRAQERIRRRRPSDLKRVDFIEGSIDAIPASAQFDVVCTHCFLDLFSGETLSSVVRALSSHLDAEGVWYFSDFRTDSGLAEGRRAERAPLSFASRSLLFVMYRFFRMTCSIEAERLPCFDEAFRRNGWRATEEVCFHRGLIRSVLLRRSSTPG